MNQMTEEQARAFQHECYVNGGYTAGVIARGYIYAIRRPDTQEIKIGWTADPVARLRNLQVAHARPLELAVAYAVDLPSNLERQLHAQFCAHRLRGEWYVESDEIRAWTIESRPNAVTLDWLRGK